MVSQLYRDGSRKIIKMTSTQIQLLGEIPRIGGAECISVEMFAPSTVILLLFFFYSIPAKCQVFNLNVISNQN